MTEHSAGQGARFPATRWSVVLAAGEQHSSRRSKALEELCRAYWLPLYLFIRRQDHGVHESEDLTQDFFAHLLRKNALASLSPGKGLFRSFLLAALKNFLADARDRANTLKRGGGQSVIPLDELRTRSDWEVPEVPDTGVSAEQSFDRQWALTVLNRALAGLGEEFSASGKAAVFERLRDFLSREGTGAEYDQIGKELNVTGGAVAVAVHRMRQDFRGLVRREVAHTVANPWEVDEEMRYLLELMIMTG